jgi:4-amino-4-deoxy-L-arabinose transferase-like glycosyltransferase
LVYLLAAEFGLHACSRLIAAFFVASLPQFAFISASVNNDNLAITLTTLATLLLVRLLRAPASSRRSFLALAVVIGCALLTKKTTLFMLPTTLAVFGAVALRQRGERWRAAANVALALLAVVAVAGWAFARNQWLYGDALGNRMEARTLPGLVDHKALWSSYWHATFAPRLAQSFVGVFGWMDVRLPSIAYAVYAALGAIALVGVVATARRPRQRSLIGVAAALIVSCGTGVVWYNLSYTQYQGRFMFPVLGPIAVLTATAAKSFAARAHEQALRRALAGVLVVALVSIDLVSLIVIYRFYNAPRHYQ